MFNKKLKQNINELAEKIESNYNRVFNDGLKFKGNIKNVIKENQSEIKSILLKEKQENVEKQEDLKTNINKDINEHKINIQQKEEERNTKQKEFIKDAGEKLQLTKNENDNFHKTIKANVEKELLRIDEKIENFIGIINKNLTDKVKELKLFKASEEMLENNPYGLAIVQELTKKAFKVEQKQYEEKANNLEIKENEIKKEYLKLNLVKSFGSISSIELQNKLNNLNDEMHLHLRQSRATSDEENIKAEAIKHTIKFINLCIKK